ncbi:hypothetical protein J2Z35_000507 [Acetoanaerobium pronyense]|uniref:Uncharacterized protein n=1 Tax=Acetoanaerobium pronyense TaxID=1482736 RepID=A0ABS4KG23_9FIRM|nr:hypothetical protein [Acetoanaerobium pronyense]MBP2026718.1 hypothetical protein [Acetoanaerobium pronyense]
MTNSKNTSLKMDFLKSKNIKITSSQDALKDVKPIEWSQSVINGSNKVLVECKFMTI